MMKLQPILSHMPPHIKRAIIDCSDTETKLNLRQIDREFKEVVESSKIYYERLTLSLSADKVNLCWQKTENETIKQTFKPTEDGYEITRESDPVKSGNGDYRKAAVAKMISVFKNPKVTVGELMLEISFWDCRPSGYTIEQCKEDRAAVFEEIDRILPLKNFRLKVGQLSIRFQLEEHMLFSVLSYMEPGILKVLHVDYKHSSWLFGSQAMTINPQITDTEQWRQLKEVEMESVHLNIPLEKYCHLERIGIRFSRRPTESVKTILEKLLQKQTMVECRFLIRDRNDFDMTGVQEFLDQLERIPGYLDETCFKHPYVAGRKIVIHTSHVFFQMYKMPD